MTWDNNRATEWYEKQPWLVGCNFIPSTAINQLEMFQEDTFDKETIEHEIGIAGDLGFNSLRIYLHDLLWSDGDSFTNIKYLESQSWPFPNQLMMAFSAEAINDQIEIDNNEILDAGWYQKDNLPLIPPEPSLSNKLIKTTLASML